MRLLPRTTACRQSTRLGVSIPMSCCSTSVYPGLTALRSAAAFARRRLRRGLDIACPVLVMCPASGWDAPGGAGGLLLLRALSARRATMRRRLLPCKCRLDKGLPASVSARPRSRSRRSAASSRPLSRGCRPIVGSSRTYKTPVRARPTCPARRIDQRSGAHHRHHDR